MSEPPKAPSQGPQVSALVLHTARLDSCAAFYRALGFELNFEQHGDGPRHFAVRHRGLHFSLREAAEGQGGSSATQPQAGTTSFGLYMDDVDQAARCLQNVGGRLIAEPRDRSFGRQARVADPDGRVIELLGPRSDSA